MQQTCYPSQQSCHMPAKCFNLTSLAISRAGGYLQLALPELSDNVMFLSGSSWRCWNRKLNEQLISWSAFRNGERSALHEPVACLLTLHHSYSRTIIHRVYDSLLAAAQRQHRQLETVGTGTLLFLFEAASR